MSKYHNNKTMMINHFTLQVKDIKKSLVFYQNVLGLDVISNENNKYHIGVDNKTLFTLISSPNVIPKTKTTGLYHFALLMPKRSDLGNLLYSFLINNIKIQGGSNHGVSEAVYLSDPDNNGIEIYVDRNSSLWEYNEAGLSMVSEVLDYETIINKRSSNLPFKMPKETIIGHMHFHVSNILEAKNFFINIIGFNPTQNAHSAIFVSDANYHHHLGFNIWNGIKINNRPTNMVGLVDYHLNVDKDKVSSFLKKLNDNDIKVNEDEKGNYIYDINNVKLYF